MRRTPMFIARTSKRPSLLSSKILANTTIIGLGVLLVVGIGMAEVRDHNLGDTAATTSVKISAPKMSTSQPPPASKILLPKNPQVILFGDSFSMGHGADSVSKGYAFLLGEHMGWDNIIVDGVGKTGYTKGGKQKYVERVREQISLIDTAPDLVIMQGAVNDTWVDYGDMHASVLEVIETIEKAWPDADVVLTAPITYRTFSDEERALRNVADHTKAIFLNDQYPSAWLPQSNELYSEDTWHPSSEGHARIAKMMAEALRVKIDQ